MDAIYTAFLLILMLINILVATLSNGWALAALIGILNISVACAALFTAIYADIYFAPYIQLMVLMVAIFTMWTNFSGRQKQ